MKKVALLFHGVVGSKNRHGQLVNYTNALKTHYHNLYENESCELDVFLQCWDMNNAVPDSKLIEDFKPVKFKKMNPIKPGGFEDYWQILNKNYHYNGNFRTKSNCIKILERIYSQMWGLYHSNELKKEYEKEKNFKYDFVIKTRYDLLLGWKPDFNSLNPEKFYSLPYNKHVKIHKEKSYKTMTDFFWITGTETMDEFVNIAPNFKDYLHVQDFIDFFAGKLEYGWVWHMINSNLYDKIELQDFVECPISLSRFYNAGVREFNSDIRVSQKGCLPFTGWKNNKVHDKREIHLKMKQIESKISKSLGV